MGRIHECADLLLKQGLSPQQTADHLCLSLGSVLDYLKRAVGEGLLRRSDIYFSFSPPDRVKHRRDFWTPAIAMGDLYDDLRIIELRLHSWIRAVLEEEHGANEAGWWRLGVPDAVRIECQRRRECDRGDPCDAYGYTDMLDLVEILNRNWAAFRKRLAGDYGKDKKGLAKDLKRLATIRNRVMHPVRYPKPLEADFEFVRGLKRTLFEQMLLPPSLGESYMREGGW